MFAAINCCILERQVILYPFISVVFHSQKWQICKIIKTMVHVIINNGDNFKKLKKMSLLFSEPQNMAEHSVLWFHHSKSKSQANINALTVIKFKM